MGTSKFKYVLKLFAIQKRPFETYLTTLYFDHAYFRIFLYADVLLDLLLENLVLLDFFLEHLVLANIATIQGLLFQCYSVNILYSSLGICADEKLG